MYSYLAAFSKLSSSQWTNSHLCVCVCRDSLSVLGLALMTCPHLLRQRAQGHAELRGLQLTTIDTLTGNLASLIGMNPNCVRRPGGGDDCILGGCTVDGLKKRNSAASLLYELLD